MMIKTCFLVSLFAFLSVPLPAQESDGLLENHDMEEIDGVTGLPAGWRSLGNKVPLAASSFAYEGSHALEITAPESGNGWVRSTNVEVEPNTTYRLKAAMLARLGPTDQLPGYGVRVYLSDRGWTPPDGQPYLFGSDDQEDDAREWKIREATFRTGENTKWLYVGLLIVSKNGGAVLLDDVLLEKIDNQAAE